MKRVSRQLTVAFLLLASALSSCSTLVEYEAQRKANRVAQARRERQEQLAHQRAEAEKLSAQEDGAQPAPAKVDEFPGLRSPRLAKVIETKEEMDKVLQGWIAFSDSAALVRDRVKAYGLGPWLASVQRLRLAALTWNDYFASMQFFPKEASLTVTDLKGFYAAMAEPDRRVSQLLVELNLILDRERSSPWKEPQKSL